MRVIGLSPKSFLVAAVLMILGIQAPSADGLELRLSRIDVATFPEVKACATVYNTNKETLAGLGRSDFDLREGAIDIQELQVSSILSEEGALAIVLVIDCSGSMRGVPLEAAKTAAREFIRRLSDGVPLGILSFSSKVDPMGDLDTNRNHARKMLDGLEAKGETALFDSIREGIRALSASSAHSKALVVLTDGHNNAGNATQTQVLELAAREGVPIYCVGLGHSANAGSLAQISGESGGELFLTRSPEDLAEIYRRIASQVQNQYVIRYRSPIPPEKAAWRTLRAQVRFRGAQASGTRIYVIPAGKSAVESADGLGGLMTPAMICLAAFNVLCITSLLLRRKGRTKWASRNNR